MREVTASQSGSKILNSQDSERIWMVDPKGYRKSFVQTASGFVTNRSQRCWRVKSSKFEGSYKNIFDVCRNKNKIIFFDFEQLLMIFVFNQAKNETVLGF